MLNQYQNQVKLLLQVLPIVSQVDQFALKGGTAINLFWRNFPRLSVDIDLTYVPIKNRENSLNDIRYGIEYIANIVSNRFTGVKVHKIKSGGTISKLLIALKNTRVKLEVNTVMRGTLFKTVEKELVKEIQDEFELFTAIHTLSLEDLYAGKLCAALDRQHPRDLFDIKLLFKNEGLTNKIIVAFIGYLISHPRPLNELINPNPVNLEKVYKTEFTGMTNQSISITELKNIQHSLPNSILNKFTGNQKEFLLSFQQAKPKWNLIPVDHLKKLPAVKWKLMNIRKMTSHKHLSMSIKLEKVLAN